MKRHTPLEPVNEISCRSSLDFRSAGILLKSVSASLAPWTIEKEGLYDYGATDLKSFLATGLSKPTTLLRIINPESLVCFMSEPSRTSLGTAFPNRTGLTGSDAFYRISGYDTQRDPELIPAEG